MQEAKSEQRGGLGTFGGVFTPSVLTILGIVLFLRLGYVVGSVGLIQALLILFAAHAISILTSLSVAAIATNLRVKGGGDYYLISRTLGLGYGGAIGTVLFLAQSVAVGFYCIGFAEAATGFMQLDTTGAWPQLIAGGAVLALFALAWLGSDWATRFQYVVMILLIAAIIVFTLGALSQFQSSRLLENAAGNGTGVPFWVVFAVFFPAVTGFTQGVSMSGDLRDASRSIPRGTFAAVGVSFLVYLAAMLLFAGAQSAPELAADGLAMKRLSTMPLLFDAGVVAATLSSALSSFLGAPRILQAMGQDEVMPVLRRFAEGKGPANNPRAAVALTAVIAMAVVASGSLDVVAGVVSMCFLLSYGLLNYATYYEASTRSPYFRPTFRFFSPRASLVGALACIAVMLAIDPTAALVAAALIFAVYQYVRLRAVPARWVDSRRSFHLQQVREHLLGAAKETEHARNWRPQILVFSDQPKRRARILRFASWVEGGAGMVSVVRVLEREGPSVLLERRKAVESLSAELSALGSTAFPLIVAAPKLEDAVPVIVQSAGIGATRANTVIVNWLDSDSGAHPLAEARLGGNLRTSFRLGCNLLVLDADAGDWDTLDAVPTKERRIDVWWTDSSTGELMLLLTHLMTRAPDWEGAEVRVLASQRKGESADDRLQQIKEHLKTTRIRATPLIVEDLAALVALSQGASLVFMPFALRRRKLVHAYGGAVDELLPQLPIVVLCLAAQDVDLGADPDDASEDGESAKTTAKPAAAGAGSA